MFLSAEQIYCEFIKFSKLKFSLKLKMHSESK